MCSSDLEIVPQGWGQFLLMFQALFVSVAVALLACFIKPIHVDPRFGLGVGALFAAVANGYLVSAQMPETGEFSLADLINLLGIGTIFLSLAQSTISLWIYETRDDPGLSRQFDRLSFWTILGCFLASLATLLGGWGVVQFLQGRAQFMRLLSGVAAGYLLALTLEIGRAHV